MGRLQITTIVSLFGTFVFVPPAATAPVVIHPSASLIVPAKVNCPTWCGQWETKWVTKANGTTTKTKHCKFWASSCTDNGR